MFISNGADIDKGNDTIKMLKLFSLLNTKIFLNYQDAGRIYERRRSKMGTENNNEMFIN